jgi:RNA polymerase sigma-70 factor, ECF subfamily
VHTAQSIVSLMSARAPRFPQCSNQTTTHVKPVTAKFHLQFFTSVSCFQAPQLATLQLVVGSAREGVALELERLYQTQYETAVNWAERQFGSRGLAEDATQEAFIQIFRSSVNGQTALLQGGQALIRRNTRWAAYKLRGRTRSIEAREQRYAASGLDSDDAWVRREARELVRTICAELPRCHREVLHLRYAEGHSDIDSARRLGITLGAFRSRHRRAIQAARTAFHAL